MRLEKDNKEHARYYDLIAAYLQARKIRNAVKRPEDLVVVVAPSLKDKEVFAEFYEGTILGYLIVGIKYGDRNEILPDLLEELEYFVSTGGVLERALRLESWIYFSTIKLENDMAELARHRKTLRQWKQREKEKG
jgi:hypothetical protein